MNSIHIPQHSSKTDRWYTPIPILSMAREVLGTIDLDPASDAFGNTRVKAVEYYGEERDGLSLPWSGSIFLNPPGGVVNRKSKMLLFWEHLMNQRNSPQFRHAIFIAFTLEALSRTQPSPDKAYAYLSTGIPSFTLCIPRARIRFDNENGKSQGSPTHANAIVYIPGLDDNTEEFVRVFSKLGACMCPALLPLELSHFP